MYDEHTTVMATTRHRSLVGRGEERFFVRDKGLAPKKIHISTPISHISKKMRTNRASSKATRL